MSRTGQPFNSHEWQSQNFLWKISNNIKQTGDENREKINQGVISWSNTKFSILRHKNFMAVSKENYYWDLGSEIVNNITFWLHPHMTFNEFFFFRLLDDVIWWNNSVNLSILTKEDNSKMRQSLQTLAKANVSNINFN